MLVLRKENSYIIICTPNENLTTYVFLVFILCASELFLFTLKLQRTTYLWNCNELSV